jgi:hypothetical protein
MEAVISHIPMPGRASLEDILIDSRHEIVIQSDRSVKDNAIPYIRTDKNNSLPENRLYKEM